METRKRKEKKRSKNEKGEEVTEAKSREREMEATSESGGETVVEQQLLQEQEQKMIIKVCVAIDDSQESFNALEWVLDHLLLYKNHHGATTAEEEPPTITVVHVQVPFQPAYVSGVPAAVYMTLAMEESMRKAHEESATKIFLRAVEICKRHEMKAHTVLMKGDPKEMICRAVEQMNADLLVVGSRGLGQIKRVFLGSVSDYCAHHAECPVLIVRPTNVSLTSN